MHPYLEARGLGALWSKLSRLPRYAATGSVAGSGVAPLALAMVYVDDVQAGADALGLVPAEAGANVWLLQPYDQVVYDRTYRQTVTAATTATRIVTTSPS